MWGLLTFSSGCRVQQSMLALFLQSVIFSNCEKHTAQNIIFQINVHLPNGHYRVFTAFYVPVSPTWDAYIQFKEHGIISFITFNIKKNMENIVAYLGCKIKRQPHTSGNVGKQHNTLNTESAVQELCLSSLLVAVAWADWVLNAVQCGSYI